MTKSAQNVSTHDLQLKSDNDGISQLWTVQFQLKT